MVAGRRGKVNAKKNEADVRVVSLGTGPTNAGSSKDTQRHFTSFSPLSATKLLRANTRQDVCTASFNLMPSHYILSCYRGVFPACHMDQDPGRVPCAWINTANAQ